MSRLDPLPTATAKPSERVAYLDNARYWIMLLVVMGHCLTSLVVFDQARGVYTWVYAFHMPFFVLISGYTARNYVGDFRQVRRIVATLIVPYLIVELSMQSLTLHYDGEPEQLRILSPQWLGWFLAALFVWRLTTPIWRALKYPIATSIIISLLAGLVEIPNVLALPKVLGFLPFYVIGLHFTKANFERLADLRVRIVAALLLAGSFVACLLWSATWNERWSLQWLLFKHRYDEAPLEVGAFEGIAMRAVILVIALVLTFAALSLIPWSRSWTTAMGERTLYAYLLHGFVIIVLDRQFDLWERVEPWGAVSVVVMMVFGIVLANLLMTRVVATIFRPLFEPRLLWFFRDPKEDELHPPVLLTFWK